MSSRFPAELILAAALSLMVRSCGRETRDYRPTAMQAGARAAAFEGNAWHIAQGQRLFGWMNCGGCPSHGGGGIGPPLMDDEWRYGGGGAGNGAEEPERRAGGGPALLRPGPRGEGRAEPAPPGPPPPPPPPPPP